MTDHDPSAAADDAASVRHNGTGYHQISVDPWNNHTA